MKTAGGLQARRTFGLEALRSVPAGMVETVATTFAVYLAVSVFKAGDIAKAALVSSGSLGLFGSLFMLQAARRLGWTANRASATLWVASALGFLAAAVSREWFPGYLAGMMLGQMTVVMAVPLLAQIYREHYPNANRGRLFAMTAVVRKVALVGAALLIGWWLEQDLRQNFPWLLASYAGACLAMGACTLAMAPVRLREATRVRLFEAFEHVRADAIFRKLLLIWMVLGFGNLGAFALFVEYVSNPRYGIAMSPSQVSWLTSFTPEAAFLCSVFIFGFLFDRMNFFVLRIVINLFFIAGIWVYFLVPGETALFVGIALHGIGRAGGNVAWNLWVNKFAKSEHVGEYMSVHTFLTGCRGTLAPVLAFTVAGNFSPQIVGLVAGLFMVVATFMVLPLLKGDAPNPGSEVAS